MQVSLFEFCLHSIRKNSKLKSLLSLSQVPNNSNHQFSHIPLFRIARISKLEDKECNFFSKANMGCKIRSYAYLCQLQQHIVVRHQRAIWNLFLHPKQVLNCWTLTKVAAPTFWLFYHCFLSVSQAFTWCIECNGLCLIFNCKFF